MRFSMRPKRDSSFFSPKAGMEPASRVSGIFTRTLTSSAALSTMTALGFSTQTWEHERNVSAPVVLVVKQVSKQDERVSKQERGTHMWWDCYPVFFKGSIRCFSVVEEDGRGWRKSQTLLPGTFLRGQKPIRTFQEDINVTGKSKSKNGHRNKGKGQDPPWALMFHWTLSCKYFLINS